MVAVVDYFVGVLMRVRVAVLRLVRWIDGVCALVHSVRVHAAYLRERTGESPRCPHCGSKYDAPR